MNLPLLTHRFGCHSLSRDHRRRHRTRLRVLSFAAAFGALAPAVSLPAADLVVQGTNSPYAFTTGTASYDNIYVGEIASGTLNQSGGTLTAATGQLFLGADAGVTGTYNLSGGTLKTISTDVGDSGTAVFTLSGTGVHNVTGTDGTANGSLDLGYYSGGSGTYNLNGGTLTAGYVRGSAGTSVFNFNGGTLTAGASATDFFQNLTHAYVGSGGANVNTNGFNVTAAQNLEHTNANGAAAIDGGLTKLGAGTLTLTGASTYTGNTTVSAGTLAVGSGGSVSGGNVSVGTGATLAISGTGSVSPGASAVLNVDGASASPASVTLGGTGTLSTGYAFIGINGTGSFTQSGGSFTTNGNTLYLGLNMGGNGTYTLSGGSLTTGLTQVSDDNNTSSFTQTGGTHTTGTLSLTGYSTASRGTYTLSGGTLNAGTVTSGDYGTSGTSTFNFNGGTLQASAANASFFSGLTTANVQAGGARIDTNGFNVTVAQPLVHDTTSGAPATDGGLTKLGSGTLTLTGANTYTGNTTVSAGTLQIGNGGTSGSLGSGSVVNNAGLVFDRSDSVSVANAISGSGNLTQAGSGTLTLTGTNTYTDFTTVIVGTLVVGAGGRITGSDELDVDAGGTLTLSGTDSQLSTSSAVVGFGGAGTFNQNAGSFTTSNTLYLGADSGSSGTYNLRGTGSQLSAAGAEVGVSGTGVFNQSGGTFTTNGSTLFVGYRAGSGSYTLSGGTLMTSRTQVGDINGTGSFTQTGGTHTTGTLSLTGYSTASRGTYTLSGGTLNAGTVTSGDYGTSGTSTFNFNGGTLAPTASSTTFLQGLTTANVQAGGAVINTNGFNVTVAQSLLHDTTAGASAVDGGLTKLGAGTLTLTGANTFTGPLSIDAGTLAAAGEASLGGGSAVTVNGGGQLAFTASTTLTRTYNLGVSTLEAASGQTLTIGSGAVVSGGYLAGPGTDALGSGSTLNGVTALVGTTLAQSDGGAATLNNVTVRGALNQTSGTLALDNALVLGSGQVTVGGTVNAAGTEIQGVATVNSGGTLATSGSSLYLTGGSRTTVNAGGTLAAASGTTVELNGALLVNNGTQTGTLDVNYGSTAKGTGSFGTVNVGDGGRFGVNASSSGATVNGLVAFHLSGSGGLAQTAFVGPQLSVAPGTANLLSLTLGSGSVFAFNVQDAQGAAGSGYDTVHAGGALTLAAGTTAGSQITISLASLGSDDTAGPVANFDPSRNESFVLVAADGGISGYHAGEFTVDTSAFQNATNGGSFSVVQQGNNLDLVFTSAVPEPGTWALLGIGAAGLGLTTLCRRRATGARVSVRP